MREEKIVIFLNNLKKKIKYQFVTLQFPLYIILISKSDHALNTFTTAARCYI